MRILPWRRAGTGGDDGPGGAGRVIALAAARAARSADGARAPRRNADSGVDWRIGVKRRVTLLLGFMGLAVAGLEARLVQLQVFQHDALVARAVRQQQHEATIAAKRGDIVDREGRLLAFSVDADSVAADPGEVVDPAATAALICEALGDCDAERRTGIARKLGSRSAFAWLARQVSQQQAERITDLKLPGITLVKETRRYYPKRELAAHVLGGVGIDNDGLAGIERVYDALIRGHQGIALVQNDARRNRMQTRIEQAATAGATLELTIDQYLQFIAERELKAGVEQNRAEGGTAVIMDPATGEVLALASYPTYNPNVFTLASDDERRNSATQGVYEPGSTFKIVTASAALQEGVVATTDLVDTRPGWIQIGSRKPINDTHQNGVLTFEDVIVESSNVGAVKTGLRVGAERLDRYIRRFGFGQTLAPDFRGESRGIVASLGSMSDSTVASMSMGYEIGVTPLQMATAASVVANGGLLMQPHVVRAVISKGVRTPVAPKVVRQAITPETAATLTTIMEEVVTRGTGQPAKLDGYRVAGKTGTAKKVVNGGYSETEYHSSFVGFAPSRQPALTILVVIDSPHNGEYYGAAVAAPVFRRIADAALRQLAVPRTINPLPTVLAVTAPPDYQAQQTRATVTPRLAPVGGSAVMPDVRGLSAREALRTLVAAGLTVTLNGSGVVVSQTPEAGAPIDRGGTSALSLQRAVIEIKPAAGGGRP